MFEGCKPHALFRVRYPHPKSLPSGKGLAIALTGSISGVSHLRNLSYLCTTLSFSSANLALFHLLVVPTRYPVILCNVSMLCP